LGPFGRGGRKIAGRLRAVFAVACLCLASPVYASPSAWLAGLPRFQPVEASAQNKALGPGINILSHDPFFETEQGAHFKEAYFGEIAARGFKTVRVPQALSRHADAQGRIDPVWLDKLDRVIRLATLSGLNVIIDNNNDHHCSDQGQTCLDRMALAWKTLAWHYRNAPASVLFELFNEPDGAVTPQMWNAEIVRMLADIRASNPTRNLIIGSAHSNNLRDLAQLQLPANDRHIIATFHYYEPYSFTHQGGLFLPPAKRPPVGARFGTDQDIALVKEHFDYVAAWSAWYHRPVLLGEFGVLETADPVDRVLWTRTIARAAEAHGISWIYWQFDGDFTAYDTARDEWIEPVARALIP
jgi:endoglucanase